MSRFLLDITDSQLALMAGDAIIQSPGAALSGSDPVSGRNNETGLTFGQVVFETLKRRPLETRTDFWAQLSTVPLNTEFAGARHSADLVYEHLKFVFAEAERVSGTINDLVIIAPSSVSQAQLELLLGILNALDRTPSAILDRALLHQHLIGKAGLHLDLQWRQMLATEVAVENGELVVGKSSAIPGSGYLDLLEQCLEHCADMCVEQTRFDPRRSADAEQLLFNAIPEALATLSRHEEAALSVNGYDFKVSRSGLEFVGKRLMAAVQGNPGAVSVDGLLGGLPGVSFDSTASQTTLSEAAEQILRVRAPDAELSRISHAQVKHSSVIESQGATVEPVETARGPMAKARSNDSVVAPTGNLTGPTHILIDAQAYSIATQSAEAQAFGLVVEGDRVQVAETFRDQVNVLSVASSHEQLQTGCRLYRNDGTEGLLIRVDD